MAISAVAQKKGNSFLSVHIGRSFLFSFALWNRSGFIATVLLGTLGGLVAAYVASLYWAFSLGIVIGRADQSIVNFSRDIAAIEAQYRTAEFSLAKGESAVLQSMVKADAIRYLEPQDVVVVNAAPHP